MTPLLTDFGLRFHHLGIAVPRPEVAFAFLGAQGYQPGAQAYDPLMRVNLAMRHHPTLPDFEVIWPGPPPSPIDRMIRAGNMIYHIGYVTDSPAASLAALAAAGFDVLAVSTPQPAVLFGGIDVSFHTVDGLGLIELLHGEPRPMAPAA
jgi:hypothetical protein